MTNLIVPTSIMFLFYISLFQLSNADYNVVDFGAKPDGETDATEPFLRAWLSACNSTTPATVYVPQGSFLIKNVVFNGPCKNNDTLFAIDGTILGPLDYSSFGDSGFWILFSRVTGVTLSGGTINARGAGFWSCRKYGKICPPGARSLSFMSSRNIVVSKIRSIDSQTMHIALDQCNNVTINELKIEAPDSSPNTDGIHVQNSISVTITSCVIMTGDDCISIGPGSSNLWIDGIICGPGHGISIGSLGNSMDEVGVQNITVTNAIFTGTENGVRIKSWARASNSYAKNIIFQNIIMRSANNPVIIDQNYCPGHKCPHESSGVNVHNVTYQNITGTSATQIVVNLDCSSSTPCSGINIKDVTLEYEKGIPKCYCHNANGTSQGVVVPKSCL